MTGVQTCALPISSVRGSEDSPGMKGTDSPCLRGSDSPRSKDSNSLPKGKEPLGAAGKDSPRAQDSPSLKGCDSPHAMRVDSLAGKAPPPGGETYEVERRRAEAERLLEEAVSSWKEAQEVLEEVKELQTQTLRRRRRRTSGETDATDTPPSPSRDEEEEGVRFRVRLVIKPIPLSRYPLARKGILFGGPAMEKSLDTKIGRASCRERVSSPV